MKAEVRADIVKKRALKGADLAFTKLIRHFE